ILREHAGPYSLQVSYKQMQLSLFYETEVVQLPNEQLINNFDNDKAYVSLQWLVEQVTRRGLGIRHLLHIRHNSMGSVHYLAILPDGRYICNCCIPLNLGIPC
ncbi:hypothetical protein DFH09DRAFT_901706, partial [Mycena vulgaris]